MARYADQLPINLAPNGANFLLATNDSDGKALERIPLELAGGGSKKYTIIDELALDVDSNFALTAGLYLYVGNAPANLDLSGLVDGERVEIINHTAHKVYLFGFNDWVWNGTTTALQTDKGLIIEKGGIIGAKHSGNLLLFNTLPNGLAQNWRAGITPLDPYSNNIVLFLKGDGENDSTNIIDSSPTPKTVSVFGNARISTVQSKYEGSSIFFDGSGDSLTTPTITLAGDFTVEFWAYKLNATDCNYLIIGAGWSSAGSLCIADYTGSTIITSVSNNYDLTGITAPLNQWFHYALSRVSGIVRQFLNGNFVRSYSNSSSISGVVGIGSGGAAPFGSAELNAYLDSIRITNVGRYVDEFNPETDTLLNV